MASGVPAILRRIKTTAREGPSQCSAQITIQWQQEKVVLLEACVDLYGGDSITVLGRAHALPSCTLFTLSHLILSNPPPPTGAGVVSTFPPLRIVFDPYTHDNY